MSLGGTDFEVEHGTPNDSQTSWGPDHDFVVDHLPGEPRVTLVGGLSGHGFKFTVLLGRIAAWMATGQPVPWNLSRFELARLVR